LTSGTSFDATRHSPGIQILYIGSSIPDGLPEDLPTISEVFTPAFLLDTVSTLLERRLKPRIEGVETLSTFSPVSSQP